MYNVKIVIPVYSNDHIKYDKQIISNINNSILDISNGYSVYNGKGIWKDDDNHVYQDLNMFYDILVETKKQILLLKNIVIELKSILSQKSIFFSVTKEDVSFL